MKTTLTADRDIFLDAHFTDGDSTADNYIGVTSALIHIHTLK